MLAGATIANTASSRKLLQTHLGYTPPPPPPCGKVTASTVLLGVCGVWWGCGFGGWWGVLFVLRCCRVWGVCVFRVGVCLFYLCVYICMLVVEHTNFVGVFCLLVLVGLWVPLAGNV